jgi:hypothetical protein
MTFYIDTRRLLGTRLFLYRVSNRLDQFIDVSASGSILAVEKRGKLLIQEDFHVVGPLAEFLLDSRLAMCADPVDHVAQIVWRDVASQFVLVLLKRARDQAVIRPSVSWNGSAERILDLFCADSAVA